MFNDVKPFGSLPTWAWCSIALQRWKAFENIQVNADVGSNYVIRYISNQPPKIAVFSQ